MHHHRVLLFIPSQHCQQHGKNKYTAERTNSFSLVNKRETGEYNWEYIMEDILSVSVKYSVAVETVACK